MPANQSPVAFIPSNWSDAALIEHVARAHFNINSGNFDISAHEAELARRFGLFSAAEVVAAEIKIMERERPADERAA